MSRSTRTCRKWLVSTCIKDWSYVGDTTITASVSLTAVSFTSSTNEKGNSEGTYHGVRTRPMREVVVVLKANIPNSN